MPRFIFSQRIDAPVEQVFRICTEISQLSDRIEGIERVEAITDGPIGIGTKWRETRKILNKDRTETMEITAFDPPNAYTIESDSCGAHYKVDHRFTPDGDGTLMEMVFNCSAVTWLAKVTAPLGWLMQGSMKRMIQEDLDALKKAAESRAAIN